MRRALLSVLLAGSLSACDGGVSAGQEIVAATLKDPSSAQFRDLKAVKVPTTATGTRMTAGGKAVCGEVNGKNSFGAYVGFKRFIVDIETKTAWVAPEDGNDEASQYEGIAFDAMFFVLCEQ